MKVLTCTSEVVFLFKYGNMTCFNQHPWLNLNLNKIMYT